MEIMVRLAQKGFAADDPQRESVHEAAGNVAETLGKDFKDYAPPIVQTIFAVLAQRPKEIGADEMPDDSDDEQDMSLTMVGEKVLGLKTSVLQEMSEALGLLNKFIKALEEDYVDLLSPTCQNLLPLLDFQVSESIRTEAFKTWEVLAEMSRSAVERGRLDGNMLKELVTGFLTKVLGTMAQTKDFSKQVELDAENCSTLQAQAVGVAGVIEKAGKGVLAKEAVRDVAEVAVKMITQIKCGANEMETAQARRRKGAPAKEDEDEERDSDDEAPEEVSPQSVRFGLADILAALMTSSPV
jgi:hypothetical protein